MSKRLIVLYVFLIVTVVFITLACTVFTVSGIQVIPSTDIALEAEESEKIIADSGIDLKSSVFTLSKAKVSTNIELLNPNIKVTKVEIKFPNKVVINVRRRTGVFLIKNGDSYAVLDRELKIIDLTNNIDDLDYCLIKGVDLSNTALSTVVTNIHWLVSVISGAESLSYINNRFYTFMPSIEYADSKIYINTNIGVTLVLSDSGDITEQFENCYQYFSAYVLGSKSEGYVYMGEQGWMYSQFIN